MLRTRGITCFICIFIQWINVHAVFWLRRDRNASAHRYRRGSRIVFSPISHSISLRLSNTRVPHCGCHMLASLPPLVKRRASWSRQLYSVYRQLCISATRWNEYFLYLEQVFYDLPASLFTDNQRLEIRHRYPYPKFLYPLND